MSDEFDERVCLLQDHVEDGYEYLSWLGTRIEAVEPGRTVVSIPYDEKLTNVRPDGEGRAGIHGGVAATLADTAGGLALRTELPEPLSGEVVTITLNVNYLRPATGALRATADVVRAGRSVGVSEVVVESATPGDGAEPVATARGSYRLYRGANR